MSGRNTTVPQRGDDRFRAFLPPVHHRQVRHRGVITAGPLPGPC